MFSRGEINMRGIFLLAAASLWCGLPAHAEPAVSSAPFFFISPSAANPLQGQTVTFSITAVSQYPGNNLNVSATIDGTSVAVSQNVPNFWNVTVGPFDRIGSHVLKVSLSLEDSAKSAEYTSSIHALNSRVVQLSAEAAAETDPKIKATILRDLFEQENLLGAIEAELADLRAAIGSQDYSFSVGPNNANPNYPFVSSVSPNAGPIGGGTPITISGLNFSTGAQVFLGGVPATNVIVVNPSTITAKSGVFSAFGAQDVEVDLPALSGGEVRIGILRQAFFSTPNSSPGSTTAPVAITSGSQAFLLGGSASVDGGQSFDWGGGGLNYRWSLLSSPQGAALQPGFVFANTPQQTFTPDVYGTYVLQLVVQQAAGNLLSSAASLAVVSVIGSPVITCPSIQVVAGQTAHVQSATSDPSPGAGEFYAISSAPIHGAGSVNSAGQVTFTAVSGFSGSDSFVVTVTNQYGLTGAVTIPVAIAASKQFAPFGN
jgi:hypothetical protein